jgi:hypothetical protein
MRRDILGAKIEQNNLNTGDANKCGLPWFWYCTWMVCVRNHVYFKPILIMYHVFYAYFEQL